MIHILFHNSHIYSDALQSFERSYECMRGNPVIDYRPLNLSITLYESDVAYNLALCYLRKDCIPEFKEFISLDAVFCMTDPLLYHKSGNMVLFRPGNLYSLCLPGNQHYQKIIYFLFFSSKRSKSTNCIMQKLHYAKVVFLLELVVIINR